MGENMLIRTAPTAYAAPAPYSRLRYFTATVDEGAGGAAAAGAAAAAQTATPATAATAGQQTAAATEAATAAAAAAASAATDTSDRGYPANTAVKDMTLEQQSSYHAYHSRKHENRVKEFGDITPEAAKAALAEVERLRTLNQSAEEKALEAAKAEGAAPFKAALAAERVNTAMTAALAGRVLAPAALASFDRTAFVKDDKADDDAIKTWVEANSTPTETARKAPNLGQGNRGNATADKGTQAGRDLFAASRKTKSTAS